MVRHIILWNFKPGMTQEERHNAAEKIKADLEALAGNVEGLLTISVEIHPLATSNAELMLSCSFTDEAAATGYQTHPLHVRAAEFIRSVTVNRMCMDYVA